MRVDHGVADWVRQRVVGINRAGVSNSERYGIAESGEVKAADWNKAFRIRKHDAV